ncbi:MAG: hypothetical protein ACOCVA_00705 [Prolixibacteraceae bacterium]
MVGFRNMLSCYKDKNLAGASGRDWSGSPAQRQANDARRLGANGVSPLNGDGGIACCCAG